MKNIKSHFVFSRQERNGIFVLLLLVLFSYAFYLLVGFTSSSEELYSKEELIAFQKEVDSLYQSSQNKAKKRYPFNPNFISDHKGYVLGMTVEEIDRLHAFRKQNRYVNSAKEFQQVTKVSDSLLQVIASDFKFPEWVVRKEQGKSKNVTRYNKDLNKVGVEDLISVTKLNNSLAYRTVRFRERLGGFFQMSQLKDVYGMKEKDYEEIKSKFQLKTLPRIKKINVNLANAQDLASLVYIDDGLAQSIIEERQLREGFKKLEELKFVESFPVAKLEHIKFYLTLE